MYLKVRKVLRCLLALIHRECGRNKAGGLMVIMTSSSCDSPMTVTVCAAGVWCSKVSSVSLQEAVKRLSVQVPPCEEHLHQDDLQKFTDTFGRVAFTHSFQASAPKITGPCQWIDGEMAITRFLHGISLLHSEVNIIFESRTDLRTFTKSFSEKAGSRVSVLNHRLAMNSAAYGHRPFSVSSRPSCLQIHPLLGDTLSCSLPADAVVAGLCGEMSLATIGTLAPCMNQYPNWPTRITRIRMIIYSPCGMPFIQHHPMRFLQSLAVSLSWVDLGLSEVCCVDPQTLTDSLQYDVEFSVENDLKESGITTAREQILETEGSKPVELTLTLFIFTQFNDAFHSQISDFINSEDALENHLDAVLWCNEAQVKETLMSSMKKSLEGFRKNQTVRKKLDSALLIVVSCVSSIIAGSSNGGFRTACYESMRVKSTCELQISLRQSLQSIIDGRFIPGRTCRDEKAVAVEQSWDEAFENPQKVFPESVYCESPSKKRRCSQVTETSDVFINGVFEDRNTQKNPTAPTPLPQRSKTRPSTSRLVQLKNEQVGKQWLWELENFSDWN